MTAIYLAMLIPVLAAVANMVLRNAPNLRDGLTLAAAVATFGCVLTVLANEGNGTTEAVTLWQVMPGLDLAFHVEPLGLMFAIIASGLWIVTHLMAWVTCAATTRTTTPGSSPPSAWRSHP
ncbi:MAG: hypothetical protein R3D85_14595 [Paracoccaceae bacterium]